MLTSSNAPALPPVTDEIRAWYKAIASRGGKAGSRTAKSISASRTAKLRWIKRKLRYPPNGLKPYKQPGWYTRRYGPPIPPEQPQADNLPGSSDAVTVPLQTSEPSPLPGNSNNETK